WEVEEEVKKLAEEEATKAALSNDYDFIQASLNADKILAEKLQTKSFDEIQALCEKIKRSGDSFIAIGSAKDEKIIKEMNEQAVLRRFFSHFFLLFLLLLDSSTNSIASDEDKEVDYEILDKKYPIIEWRSKYLTTKPQ
ncbi:hypothetical protein Tco_0125837, partial [Tanacetum coccineum]